MTREKLLWIINDPTSTKVQMDWAKTQLKKYTYYNVKPSIRVEQ